ERGGVGCRRDPTDDRAVEGERCAPELGSVRGRSLELQPREPSCRREFGQPFERGLADEPRLGRVYGPTETELGGRVVGERVLTEVEMTLLQPEHLECVEPQRRGLERPPFAQEGVPHLGSVRTWVVQLERQLADEPAPDRPARNARD